MAVKVTGAEFKRFYNDDAWWPEADGGTWHEDVSFSVDGKEVSDGFDPSAVADSAQVSFDGGAVLGNPVGGGTPTMDTYFKRWRKAQATRMLVIEVDVTKLDAVTAAVVAAGGKVVK